MPTYKKWSEAEIAFIKDNHAFTADEEMAVKISQMTNENVTTAMIRRQRRKLKLGKKRGRPTKNKSINTSVSVEPNV